jgi:hypothetical protein
MRVAVHVPDVWNLLFLKKRMNTLADANEIVLVPTRDTSGIPRIAGVRLCGWTLTRCRFRTESNLVRLPMFSIYWFTCGRSPRNAVEVTDCPSHPSGASNEQR